MRCRRPGCTTWRCCARTSSGRFASTRGARVPLTEIFENRDYAGSNHFFFDIGNGNLLAFFDLPGLDLGPYAEVLGGLHHLAISVEPERWEQLKRRLQEAGVATRRKAEPRSTSPTPTAFASS